MILNLFNIRYKILPLWLLSILLFLLTANKILNIIPVDKVTIFLLSFSLLLYTVIKNDIKRSSLIIGLTFTVIVFLSFLSNIEKYSFQVFYPLIGLLFTLNFVKHAIFIKSLYYGLFIHIIIGIILNVSVYVGVSNDFNVNLAYKGLPFLNSAMAFAPTPQTYGTICLIFLILFFHKKELFKITKIDKVFYLMTTIAILLTINRTTIIGYLLILYFKQRKLFITYIIISIVLFAFYWKLVLNSLFNSETLDSRDQLLESFNLSFWGSHSWSVYLFGKADNKIDQRLLRYVTWDYRDDIENGFAMILHTYGFAGLIYYLITSMTFITNAIKKQNAYLCMLIVFFVFFSPYITQEYVATSFYIILGVLIYFYQTDYGNKVKAELK